ncbi:MAG: protein kinase [Myxococcales bacterium]|nr:protein kinase [Myxococcales bacterium]
MSLPLGEMIAGRYRLREVLGRGGVGVVYQAQDVTAGHEVAIKVIGSEAGAGARERLWRGARLFEHQEHSGIVRVHDSGSDGGVHFVVTEYCPGGDLQQLILSGGWSVRDVLDVVLGAGDVLAAVHAEGIVHGNVKPSNILIDGEGEAKLTDFELVGSPRGTSSAAPFALTFDAPESREPVLGAPIRPAADVFSLAMCVVVAITGSRGLETLDCPPRLERALQRALAGDPAQRCSVTDFCTAVREVLDEEEDWGRSVAGRAGAAPTHVVGRARDVSSPAVPTLDERLEQLVDAVWQHGPVTVHELQALLPWSRPTLRRVLREAERVGCLVSERLEGPELSSPTSVWRLA